MENPDINISKRKGTYQHLTHDAFGPLYDENSLVLILGSFPSVKSREAAFYYGHPQNRFWPLMSALFCEKASQKGITRATKEQRAALLRDVSPEGRATEDHSGQDILETGEPGQNEADETAEMPVGSVLETRQQKTEFILTHHLALWDVIESCDIIGSSDASIRNVQVTDIAGLLPETKIRKIFINGATAYKLFMKYQSPALQQMATKLPSTSPANAAWTLEKLKSAWQAVPDEVERLQTWQKSGSCPSQLCQLQTLQH